MLRDILREAKLFDIKGQAVIATDVKGAIVYWSSEAERIYGWEEREVIGRDIMSVTVTDLSREEAARIMDMLQRGQSWTGEFLVRSKAGKSFHVNVVDVPVRTPAGELAGIIGVSKPATPLERPRPRAGRKARQDR